VSLSLGDGCLKQFPRGGRLIPPVYRLVFRRLECRRWIPALILCLGLASCRPAQAQGFDATDLREPTDLAAGWLVHAGDDPAYARPDFDDSQWTPFNATTDSLHKLFPNSRPEIVWYRLHVKVAPNQTGLGLLENQLGRAFEVYSNGVRLIQVGKVRPYKPYDYAASFLASIPSGQIASGKFVIAIRYHVYPGSWWHPQPGYNSTNLTLGQEGTLHEHMWYRAFGYGALDWLDDLVNLGMLLGAALLYSTQRDRPEYLWLFLWIASSISNMLLSLYSLFHTFPMNWNILQAVSWAWPYFYARMYCTFAGHRVGWRLQLYLGLTCIGVGYVSMEQMFGSFPPIGIAIANAPLVLLQLVILPSIMIADIRRGNRETGFLLLPLLITGVYLFCGDCCAALEQIPEFRDRAWKLSLLVYGTMAGPFDIDYWIAADILSMLSLALIILIRSNRISRQQSLLEAEMANAREVQQVILPEQVEAVPGFRVESVYLPAKQVGGDFFQVLPADECGLLLVIGDVAGKGLPAAMLVSVLVGSIRTAAEDTHDPGLILRKLNDRLLGRTHGGFSTALAALFSADGSVTIANAGHLPPYLDGCEIELPGTLPLGIVSAACYEAVQLCLEPGSKLTFYTDGVIEAQDKQGHLFGFERGKAISTQPAEQIVKAAQQFGQTDDITVVVIQREAQVPAAPSDELIGREPVIPSTA
jgi:hypothetical protein